MEKLIPYKNNLCSKYAEKMISIKLTSECNAKCSFCVDRGGYTPKDNCGGRILVPDVDAIVESANKYKDYKTVIITGGEPLMRKEAIYCITEIAKNTLDVATSAFETVIVQIAISSTKYSSLSLVILTEISTIGIG